MGEQRARVLFAGPPARSWAALCAPAGQRLQTHMQGSLTPTLSCLSLRQTPSAHEATFSSRASRKFHADTCVLAWFGSTLLCKFLSPIYRLQTYSLL